MGCKVNFRPFFTSTLLRKLLLHPPWSHLSPAAWLRRRGGVRAQAGEAQRRPRLPPQVPLRKLPTLYRGRPRPAGALVPRVPRGDLHAPAGIQGKRRGSK